MANVIEFTIKGIDRFSKTIGAVGRSLKRMGSALSAVKAKAAIAAAALTAFILVTANGIDSVAKFSNRIGISVEQLSKMQFVAGQAGLSTMQFNLSVQRMTRRVAEAAVGTGEAQGALKELGIDAKSFKDLGLEDQFALLADKLKGAGSESDKLRLAFKLFDSEGTAVLQMLKGGSEAMRAYAKDAEFLGLVISKQAAANTEAFTDSVGRLGGAIKGVSRAIFNEMAPVLTGLSNRVANTLAGWREGIAAFVKGAIFWIFTFIEMVKQLWNRIKQLATLNKEAWSSMLQGIVNFVKTAGALFIVFMKSFVTSIWTGIKLAAGLIKDFGVWVGGWIKSVFTRKTTRSFSDAMGEALKTRMKEAAQAISTDIDATMRTFRAVMKRNEQEGGSILGIDIGKAKEDAKAAINELSEYGKVQEDTIKSAANTLVDTTKKQLTIYQEFLKSLKDSAQNFVIGFFDLVKGTVQELSDAVAESIVSGKKLSESFKQIAQGVLKTIISMLIKWGIQRLILSKLTNSANAAEAAAVGAKNVAAAGSGGTASMAAAPFPINLTAPAFGAAMMGAAASLFSTGMGIGGSLGAGVGAIGGIAHNGLTDVPREGTFLLDRGERVVSAAQNRDLTEFLNGGGASGNVTIENVDIRILENATNTEALLNLSSSEWEELVADPILRAFNTLDRRGIRPNAIERKKF